MKQILKQGINTISRLFTLLLDTTEQKLRNYQLPHQADIEARDEYNQTPLHAAAINNSTDVAQLLITYKTDIETRDKYNRTPLHAAARHNRTEAAQLLITHKADIEARGKDNCTPLHEAALKNRP